MKEKIVVKNHEKYSVVGKRVPKQDGPQKATGRAQFTDDMVLPGMLHGKIIRSSVPRGKIRRIDTSRAERLMGVKAVITPKDAVGISMRSGEPLLCNDMTVNYIGQEIVAIAAMDEDTACEAAELVRIEYEPLKAVFSIDDAIAEGAPLIHAGKAGNRAKSIAIDYGDTDRAFSEAEYIRKGEYTVKPCHNCYAEHHVVIADHSVSGKLEIWTPNQSPLIVQQDMTNALGISESNVRVLSLHTGGAFSGRVGARNHHFIAAILSRKSSRPVKIRCTADEEFIVYKGGGEQRFSARTGAMKDGTLKAIEGELLIECGAYLEPVLVQLLRRFTEIYTGTAFYKVDGMRFRANVVYTNHPPRNMHHGASALGVRAALESEMDLIGQHLGLDPVAMRLKNAVEKGDKTIGNIHYASCGLKTCIEKVAKHSAWKKKYGKLQPFHGIGIGCGGINSGGKVTLDHDTSAAIIKIEEDGKATLLTGIPDMGQGSHTVMAMIAAETLGIFPEDVTVVSGDTDVVPLDIGAFSQRGTLVTGNAVKAACLDARKQLARIASKKLGVNMSSLCFRNRLVYAKKAPEKPLSFDSVVHDALHSQEGRYVMGKGFYNPPSPSGMVGTLAATPAFSFGAQIAEVEVDPETGTVRLIKMTVAHDVGRALNPLAVEGQIDGQVFSGMGQTLHEQRIQEKGLVLNPSFLEYKLPRPFEVPEIERIIVETIDPYGPFGAKEVGEGPIMAVPGAIAGAVSNAIGYPITEFPITPEAVLRALRQKKNPNKRAMKE
ncbi:MAG: xanthine dehydrogenase family protein molybdopterin-binding subunit [Desulfobacterales bacterium]|jgi:CO/xanthine dehydrogenase Mo-binding subunit|nr:xanthine dehydrogenase family protein molybdopterin-binding subunit [Desulfobacterales bacterium]